MLDEKLYIKSIIYFIVSIYICTNFYCNFPSNINIFTQLKVKVLIFIKRHNFISELIHEYINIFKFNFKRKFISINCLITM